MTPVEIILLGWLVGIPLAVVGFALLLAHGREPRVSDYTIAELERAFQETTASDAGATL
jgi:hypothetical protein